MRTFLFLATATFTLFAGSVEYGRGTFHNKFALFGKGFSISTDISTYSLVEQHKNIFSSNFYYRYNITWMQIERFQTAKQTIAATPFGFTAPAMSYEPKGLDLDIGVGRDFIKKDERNFFGAGIDIGLSIPTIETSQKSNGSFTLGNFDIDVTTYKVGPHITFSKSVGTMLSLYGSGEYTFNHFRFKASRLQSSIDVDGRSYRLDIGLRLDLLHKNYKVGFLHLSPRLYGVAGYRYQKWSVDSFTAKIVNFALAQRFEDFTFRTNYGYFGIGYSF